MAGVEGFEGCWVDEDGVTLHVDRGELRGPDGEPLELVASGPDTCSFTVGGQTFEGWLEAGGQRLLWSDGAAWTRREPAWTRREQREQLQRRSAGFGQALTFERASTLGATLRVVAEAAHVVRACREAAIEPSSEDLWQAAAGHTVTVLATDPIDSTLECRVPGIGDMWLPVTALLPALDGGSEQPLQEVQEVQDPQLQHKLAAASGDVAKDLQEEKDLQLQHKLAAASRDPEEGKDHEKDEVEEDLPKQEEPWTGWEWETGEEEPFEEEPREEEPCAQPVREGVCSQGGQGWFEERSERLWRELQELEACGATEQRRRLRALQLELHPDKQPVEMRAQAQRLFLIVQTEWEAAQKALAAEKQQKEREETRKAEHQRQDEAQRSRDEAAAKERRRTEEERQRQRRQQEAEEDQQEEGEEEEEDVSLWSQARYKEAAEAFKLREAQRLRQEEELRVKSQRLTSAPVVGDPRTSPVEVQVIDPASEEYYVSGKPLYVFKKAKRSWLICDVKQEIESRGRIPRRSQGLSLTSPTQVTTEELEDDEPLSSLPSGPCVSLMLFVAPHRYEDYAHMLKALQSNWKMLRWVPLPLRSDRTIIRTAVRQDWRALRYASRELRSDRALVYKAVRQDGAALEFAEGRLPGDRALVQAALRHRPLALQFASLELRGDAELVLRAVRQDLDALQFAAPQLLAGREFFLAAVEEDAQALRYASTRLRADRELLLAAVRQDPSAVQFAGGHLKEDKELALTALRQNPKLLEHVSPSLRMDKQVLAVCQGNWEALKHVDGEHKGSAEAALWKESHSYFNKVKATYMAGLFKNGKVPQTFDFM